jgi:sugar lactone lactonase YvrE
MYPDTKEGSRLKPRIQRVSDGVPGQTDASAQFPPRLLRVAAAFLLFVAVIVPTAALGNESGEEGNGLEIALSEIAQDSFLTNPEVAAELPHTGLDREGVLALVGGVFDPKLEAAAGPFDSLEVDHFLSSTAAVVSADRRSEPTGIIAGKTEGIPSTDVLLESTLPLRHEGEVVDLSLTRTEDAIESTNPLVPVMIPGELGDGIELPEQDIEVSLPGVAEDRTPSILGESSAVYPNIGPDTDFIVAPSPTGFETFTVLRSPDAPQEQRLSVDLPSNFNLEEAEDGSITISSDTDRLMRISTPSAIDAQGRDIPASMELEQDTLVLSVRPDADTSWPVLLDPMFETYQWEGTSLTACGDFQLSGGPLVEQNSLFSWNCGTIVTGSYTVRGLAVKANQGTFYNGAYEQFLHEVPRLKQDEQVGGRPTTYFAGMTLSNVTVATSGGPNSPYALAGVWDDLSENWAGNAPYQAVWGYPGNAASILNGTVSFTTGNDQDAKVAVPLALTVNESTATTFGPRRFSIGAASFELAETGATDIVNPSATTLWANETARQNLSATVKDTGLGAKKALFAIPGQGTVAVENSCIGNVASPCPVAWTATLSKAQYNPALMPQGEAFVRVTGKDVIGNSSAVQHVLVLVDHSAPTLGLTGDLTEQATIGTGLGEYTLNYSAADGDDAAAASQAPFGTKGTGSGQLERPQGVAVDAQGNVWVTDRVNHRVVAYDKTGAFLRQFGTQGTTDGQIKEPRGIAIGLNGNIWVAEAGNKRVQQFTPTGTFVSKLTRSEFSEPWGVAVGPDGKVWVSDSGAQRVFQFKEDGTYIRNKATSQLASGGGVPYGIDVDASGNGWVALQSTHKVAAVDSELNPIFSFGSEGTGNGQFRHPADIAVADSGNVLVTDDLNARVQVFESDGTYLRQFGTGGTGNAQFNAPRGVDVAGGNQLVVADANNARVARWAHADQDPQSGATKVQIKVDGTTKATNAPGCTTKNCAVSGSWTLDADDYAGGAHKVEVIATDAVGIETTKTLDIETHGDGTNPTLALSGTITQQASLGTTRASYKLKAVATDPGPAAEKQSGIASTVIKVDGSAVDSTAPGCPAGGCSITREWTLDSDSYSVGSHAVEVKATDAAGRTTTKTVQIEVARDNTSPEFGSLPAFYTAPSGWLEQKTYSPGVVITDNNGYGVTSVQLKIDGEVVQSWSGTCPAGSCLKGFGYGQTVEVASYDGGAHPAELIATDGAGNARKRTWTINVTPVGEVPPAEAADTLEAMEETVPSDKEFLPVASTVEFLEPEIVEAGGNPHLKEEAGQIVSAGVTVDTTIDPQAGVVSIEGTEGKLEITPQLPMETPEVVAGAAAVLPASNASSDTVVRPEYSGAYMFTTIRDANAPENYEWHLKLHSGQYLVQANPQQIEVKWAAGVTAFLITAEPAHDATGNSVPTTLSILEGSDISLSVPHRNQGYTYPVVAGQGYETGYATVTVYIPDEEETVEPLSPEEQQELDEDAFFMNAFKGTTKTRNRNKPFTKKQAKRLARIKKNGRTVPAPSASASSSPGYPSQPPKRTFALSGRTCAEFNCDIWQVELNEGTFVRGPNWVVPSAYMHEEKWSCDHHVSDWYTWNIDLDLGDEGIDGSHIERGSGEHLTFWCDFNVQIYPIPVELAFDGDQALEVEVYPNGYQVSHGVWKSPYSFIPFDLPW